MVAALKIRPSGRAYVRGRLGRGQRAARESPPGRRRDVPVDNRPGPAHAHRRAGGAAEAANIKTCFGQFTDPKLPVPVDLAFMNDVLLTRGSRAYIKAVASYLKPAAASPSSTSTPAEPAHRASGADSSARRRRKRGSRRRG